MSNRDGKRNRVIGDINVTPLVDIMLVLLVVFMVNLPSVYQAFKLNLPKETAEKLDSSDTYVTVDISGTGELSLDGVAIDSELLVDALKKVVAERGEGIRVRIRADVDTRYGNITRVLSSASAVGLNKVSFLTLPNYNHSEVR